MNLKSVLKSSIIRFIPGLIFNSGLKKVFYPKLESKDLILLFHSVVSKQNRGVNIRNTGQREFEQLLRCLSSDFDIVPLKTMFESTGNSPRIAITFDDGLANNLHFAFPVLKKFNLPATIFITTCRTRGESMIPPDRWSLISMDIETELIIGNETYKKTIFNQYKNIRTGEKLTDVFLRTKPEERGKFVNEVIRSAKKDPELHPLFEEFARILKGEEIKILSDSPLISIGSHCVTHENLLLVSPEEQKEELIESKKYLEQVTGKTIDMIAYPFGKFDKNLVKTASESGYNYQLAVNYPDDSVP